MNLFHSTSSICHMCSQSYKLRISQLQKHIKEMFLNICNNEILKQLCGSPELQNLRFRKIQQIMKDVLYGQKEQLVQSLIQKNLMLQSQQNIKTQLKEENSKLQKIRIEYSNIIYENNVKYQNQINLLEQKYKQMMISSLQQYQKQFNRLNQIHQQQAIQSKNQIQQLKQINKKNTKIQANNKYLNQKAIKQQLKQKQQIIQQLNLKLCQADQIIQQLQTNYQQVKSHSQQISIYSKQIQLLNQRTNTLQSQNMKLKEKLYLIDQQNNILKNRQSRIIQQANNVIVQQEEFIMKKQLPDIILNNQVQLYKLKEEYQTQIFMCHKKYSKQIQKLNYQIDKLNNQKNKISNNSSNTGNQQITTHSNSGARSGAGKIAHVKKGYVSLIDQFGKELGNLKKQFTSNKQLNRKVQ